MQFVEQVLNSREVAEMVGKDHSKLLRDIRKYGEQLGEAKIGLSDFFTESTYITEQNKTMPCYLVTKKGCEFIAHKLTGQKGTEFTAKYINRFHEMEQELTVPNATEIPIGEIASYLKAIDRAAVRQNTPPYKIMEVFKMVSEQFGIRLPDDLVRVPAYEQMALDVVTR
ncbi:MAG: Rha family transcriptional regulator [Lachnospiraceae bacterium]|jgi:Rha family phage regulatory protein|nr:Rha family transcriptional regulator [Lachnospiraceae bacterium]